MIALFHARIKSTAMRSRRPPQIVATPGVRPFDAGTFGRLCRARDYLAAHYARPVFLAEASRQACLPPFYFNRLFTQSSNETPHEFVRPFYFNRLFTQSSNETPHEFVRIERAKMPLLAGNHSVTEICFEVGYQSLGSV